jgi:hypothetical protein
VRCVGTIWEVGTSVSTNENESDGERNVHGGNGKQEESRNWEQGTWTNGGGGMKGFKVRGCPLGPPGRASTSHPSPSPSVLRSIVLALRHSGIPASFPRHGPSIHAIHSALAPREAGGGLRVVRGRCDTRGANPANRARPPLRLSSPPLFDAFLGRPAGEQTGGQPCAAVCCAISP